MSFDFTPMTDDELDALLPDGEYNFEVLNCKRKPSAKGNPMAVLDLKVWNHQGGTQMVFDMLIFTQVNMCIRKISHFCKATGIYEDFKKGSIPEDLSGLSGKAIIGTQEEMKGNDGRIHPRKNIVTDYLSDTGEGKSSSVRAKVDAPADEGFDDSIPF